MEYIYIARQKDQEVIKTDIERFKELPLNELVDLYNRQVKCGITGVHRQALYLLALRIEFKRRLAESPVYLMDYVLGFVGEIEVSNGNIRPKSEN
ncbi:hypothetical protein [Winogradskyella vincentii]|uniref:Uncharacterized protein n=1 Tax=Winogradskyella vincentii TaxID=2877122 RepID=A0ABS7Y3F0_9FLAO|nr:hypothetical protein [Winogradskyella vincentii]MCA0154464.1 hypothetical protein [Winogradskyella vincentii]